MTLTGLLMAASTAHGALVLDFNGTGPSTAPTYTFTLNDVGGTPTSAGVQPNNALALSGSLIGASGTIGVTVEAIDTFTIDGSFDLTTTPGDFVAANGATGWGVLPSGGEIAAGQLLGLTFDLGGFTLPAGATLQITRGQTGAQTGSASIRYIVEGDSDTDGCRKAQ